MPTHLLRLSNVHLASPLSTLLRRSHALARTAATEPTPTIPALKTTSTSTTSTSTSTPQFYTRSTPSATMETTILPVDPTQLGTLHVQQPRDVTHLIEEWDMAYAPGPALSSLQRAAKELRETCVPVAFPTETVYGLGADATRSAAVRAIFAAKGRPADNPLIVHVHSLSQLRALLQGNSPASSSGSASPQSEEAEARDLIPVIYKPLIERFWPGPLTLIMPVPEASQLAPEVTAGLNTFGARMPRSILALALIRMAGVPLAAPSANASTRPSPTAAEHVKDDLDGRIATIIDGGPCEVGVESTVVDGLSHPPAILRPGGVTVEQLRQCPGWEDVRVAYKDKQEEGSKPRAPGMKYRHYSPKATVVLYEGGGKVPGREEVFGKIEGRKSVGIVRTKTWARNLGLGGTVSGTVESVQMNGSSKAEVKLQDTPAAPSPRSNLLRSVIQHQVPHATQSIMERGEGQEPLTIWDIALGTSTEDVARGLFSALRELDKKGVDMILVEGIDDNVGDDIAAAVMNRLRKAAEIRI